MSLETQRRCDFFKTCSKVIYFLTYTFDCHLVCAKHCVVYFEGNKDEYSMDPVLWEVAGLLGR